MISLRGVSLVYPNGVRALDNVDLEIEKGAFVFLVGHSGTGKSSLLRVLYREMTPSTGEVIVDGIRVDRLHRSRVPALRRHLGVVFQDFKLLTDKTVWENVAFAMQVTGARTKDVMRQVPRALDLVGLSHKSRMYPGELSGGEQQRTAIARALVNNPKLLLCDEPTGNLDPSNTTEIMELLLRINLKGTTVVVATHNQAVVDRMRRRVVRLEDGRIVTDEERGYYFLGFGKNQILSS
ncbi:MAG: cell division ATP-binding protein FtsE [Candidatus Eremiobacteraeota bacterium]|nr:cell division ATP-binding protein FtsE [Candidatus Eremiobacteraeota bacterium]